mmetsp:Transcript_28583/g.46084  ORF Transcript_28583/g.46084 Transcript_28583/m.46084 type:complete len:110 (+) Transcript_28583:344-673(+)
MSETETVDIPAALTNANTRYNLKVFAYSGIGDGGEFVADLKNGKLEPTKEGPVYHAEESTSDSEEAVTLGEDNQDSEDFEHGELSSSSDGVQLPDDALDKLFGFEVAST